jgi:hypothetical protein
MKISELPEEVRAIALLRQREEKDFHSYFKKSNSLIDSFNWTNTIEGNDYWEALNEALGYTVASAIEKEAPKHYNNSKGSLYRFCEEQDLNTYEFDIIKRVMRCRKKGNFIEDLEKTKFLIDLYIKEMKEDEK